MYNNKLYPYLLTRIRSRGVAITAATAATGKATTVYNQDDIRIAADSIGKVIFSGPTTQSLATSVTHPPSLAYTR